MFNKYWREYPIWLQMLLLILMIFTMVSAALVFSYLLTPMITGVSVAEAFTISEDSPQRTINAFKLLQAISNLFMFCGSAFLFAYASHPDPVNYLGFKKIKKPLLIIIALAVTLSALPLVQQLGQWMRELNISVSANESQERNDLIMKIMMNDSSAIGLISTLLVLALVPALSEELFFRGVIMRFVHKRTKNLGFSVFMSAAIFAFLHPQPYNLPSIFIMGMLLGYIYYYTGSIWVSIIAHFMNNALQVLVVQMANTGMIPESATEDSYPWYILVVASGVAVLFFMLLKKQATPLTHGWSSDFTVAELEQKLEDLNNRQ